MLKVEGVHVSIQSVVALRGLSLVVNGGSMVGLVGRNGAGKTTMLRTIMGHLKPTQGSISFDGQDLTRIHRHERAVLGIGYMPEDRGLVPELTVEENILVPIWVSKSLKADERLAFVYQGGFKSEVQHLPPSKVSRCKAVHPEGINSSRQRTA
jgi:branched-chain amino acid transport system ATP-binding protein